MCGSIDLSEVERSLSRYSSETLIKELLNRHKQYGYSLEIKKELELIRDEIAALKPKRGEIKEKV